MNYIYCLILLFIPFIAAYPRSHSNNFDRFVDKYLKERSANLNEVNNPNSNAKFAARRRLTFPLFGMQQHQPTCLPNVWTCGPGLPPCCSGLMCYDGNAKRGRHCVARG
jgi:hypothetical protein